MAYLSAHGPGWGAILSIHNEQLLWRYMIYFITSDLASLYFDVVLGS